MADRELAEGVSDDGDWRDGYVSTWLTLYDQSFERHTGVARLALDWRSEPDPEHVTLGMKVRLATYSLGADDQGTEAIGFGFEPA